MPIQGIFKPMQLIMTMKVGSRGFVPAAKINVTEKSFILSIETTVAEVCDDYFNIGIERIGPGITAENYNLIFEENLNQNARCEMFTMYDYVWKKTKEQEIGEGREVPNYNDYYLSFDHAFEEVGIFLQKTFVINLKIMDEKELVKVKQIYLEDEYYDLVNFIDTEIATRKKK